ncbi:hypothetical protein Fmac_027234 [Flemingia macrophylla]|uniref:Uncharacterized protein n=1 Tax=Flemingia macrophylla TaxID=520843 RepID=A0ABD1LH46_9FABA
MTKQKERRKESKLRQYLKAPLRFLRKARDMYVRGMVVCSAQFSYVDVYMGCPSGQLSSVPRSFSVNSASTSQDDFKDLVRAASLRSYGNRFDFREEAEIKMSRSRSLGIGTIDENKPFEFDDGDVIKIRPNIYPRSKSYAARRGGAALFI